MYGPYKEYLDSMVISRSENYTVMAQNLPGKKKEKSLRRHEVLCGWKCLLPCKGSAILFSSTLLLLKIF